MLAGRGLAMRHVVKCTSDGMHRRVPGLGNHEGRHDVVVELAIVPVVVSEPSDCDLQRRQLLHEVQVGNEGQISARHEQVQWRAVPRCFVADPPGMRDQAIYGALQAVPGYWGSG